MSIPCHHYEGGPNGSTLLEHQRRNTLSELRSERIPCPGGCGGLAELEAPLATSRDGTVTVTRWATCLHTCRTEVAVGAQRQAKPRPTRFELPCEEEAKMTLTAKAYPDRTEFYETERARFKAAVEKAGVSVKQIAELHGVCYANVLRWCSAGRGLSPKRQAPLLSWAADVESGAWETPSEMLPAAVKTDAVRRQWQTRRKAAPQSFADDPAGTEKAKATLETKAPIPSATETPWEAMMRPYLEEATLAVIKARGFELPEGASLRVVLEWGVSR